MLLGVDTTFIIQLELGEHAVATIALVNQG
jgi:hypothetical protein